MTDIEKMNLESKDLVAERIEQLKSLFPEISTEDSIDFDKLRLILGDEVEAEQERYTFTWPGKAAAIRQSQTVSTAALRPHVDKSRGRDGKDGSFDSDNIYIEGDNLEVLKLLQRGYHGKIKMIYIDPPYNTGHDFVYKDKFGDTIANYKEQAGLAGQSNADTSGRYHSDWCSMMYPRLRLARELLTDDGVIFISIDDNESRNLRILCDEVFGEICFVGDIAWQKTYSPRNDSKTIPAEVEHIIAYSKQAGWIPERLKRTATMDERYSSPDKDPHPWSSGDAAAPGAATHQGMVYAIQHPMTGELLYPPIGRCRPFAADSIFKIMNEWADYEWRDIHDQNKRAEICGLSETDVRPNVKALMLKRPCDATYAAAKARYNQGRWPRLYFTSGGMGGMRLKRYLDEMSGKAATNLWLFSDVGHTDEAKKELKRLFSGAAPFDTPKPVRLLERILRIASTPDSIVLDFFSGSATMAEAVIRKNAEDDGNRNFILVQIPEKASGNWGTLCEVGEERIRRAGDKIKAELEQENSQLKLDEEPKTLPDIGFRVFSLDESGIEKPEPGQLMLDVVKPDRSELDIVFEMMLKWGLELTHPVEKTQAAGYPIWSVACDELICCMSPGLTSEAVEAIAAMEPRRVLILDSILSDTLKLNTIQTFKHASERMGYEIELRTV
jgi:site-specific DNA-methyltransferase